MFPQRQWSDKQYNVLKDGTFLPFPESGEREGSNHPITQNKKCNTMFSIHKWKRGRARRDEWSGECPLYFILFICQIQRKYNQIGRDDRITKSFFSFSKSPAKGRDIVFVLALREEWCWRPNVKVLCNFKRFTKLSYYSIESAVAGVEGVKHRNPFL